MSETSKYFTTPIYYVNDVPHLGHAYTTIAVDTLARYWRDRGVPTFFLTGTDEHGQKIESTAVKQGMTPKALADRVVVRFQHLWTTLNIRPDDFIRTTQSRHHEVVQALWKKLEQAGDIYLGDYEGWYCEADEAYYAESELVNGLSPTGRPVEKVREPSYFFRLSKFQKPLSEYFRANPQFVQPQSRYNEILSFIDGGLHDLSISRTRVKWGIPVPGAPEHTVYVWLDALTNYLTALGGFGDDVADYKTYWPEATHVIGKDILRFHAVYWPAFLMSAGLPLPERIFAHGWWTVEGQKMSKTTRNVVDPFALVEAYGVDAIRYFVLREVPFGSDGDFSHDALIRRINSDLANDLGNLVRRVGGMIERFCGGAIPTPSDGSHGEGPVARKAVSVAAEVQAHMEALAFHRALESIWQLVSEINTFVDRSAPWKLAKDDPARLATVLYECAEGILRISRLLKPFMPESAEKVIGWLGLDPKGADAQTFQPWGNCVGGRKLGELPPLFPRIEEDRKAEIKAKFRPEGEAPSAATTGGKPVAAAAPGEGGWSPPALKPAISIDDFGKTDLRVAVVLAAEAVPKSKKLLKLTVDVGEASPRTIVAGIAQHYAPEALVGKRIVVVANLEPAKLMGIESQGMVLAGSAGGALFVLAPEGELAPGAQIR